MRQSVTHKIMTWNHTKCLTRCAFVSGNRSPFPLGRAQYILSEWTVSYALRRTVCSWRSSCLGPHTPTPQCGGSAPCLLPGETCPSHSFHAGQEHVPHNRHSLPHQTLARSRGDREWRPPVSKGCSHSVPGPPRDPQGDVPVISSLWFTWDFRGCGTGTAEHQGVLFFILVQRLSSLYDVLPPQGALAPWFAACPALLSLTLIPPGLHE